MTINQRIHKCELIIASIDDSIDQAREILAKVSDRMEGDSFISTSLTYLIDELNKQRSSIAEVATQLIRQRELTVESVLTDIINAPTLDDVWEIDQSQTDLALMYRTEQP